jgi:hypothetical protein
MCHEGKETELTVPMSSEIVAWDSFGSTVLGKSVEFVTFRIRVEKHSLDDLLISD